MDIWVYGYMGIWVYANILRLFDTPFNDVMLSVNK